jgi:type II secretory pathway pseudopilin PulG
VFELLAVMAAAGILITTAAWSMQGLYNRHKLTSAGEQIQSAIVAARVRALKEKTPYRIVFRDETATSPNRVEMEREVSGSFVSLPTETLTLPGGVLVGSSGSTNSMDTLTIGRRGDCGTGSVYLLDRQGQTRTVSVATTCLSSLQ